MLEKELFLSRVYWISSEYDELGNRIQVACIQEKADSTFGSSSGRTPGYSETMRRRRYEWDVNHQLKKVTNEVTKGTAMFSYDQFSSLVCAKETGFETIFRTPDMVGNFYETQDNSDRIYGAGSRLEQSGIDLKEKRNAFQGGHGKLVTKGIAFFYY